MRLKLNNKGQTLVEYVLIISLITVVAIAAVKILGGRLKDKITEVGCEISGKVYVETVNSNIEFTNKDSEDIEIIGGKKVKATRLTGTVHIKSNGDTELKFTKITNKTTIELGDKCYSAIINAEQNTARDTDFYLTGKYVVRYEDEAPVKKGENGTAIDNDFAVEGDASINVSGKNAEIHVYFKKP